MKKILAIALALVMVLAMVACGEKPAPTPDPTPSVITNADEIADEMTTEDGKYEIGFVTDVGQLKDGSFNQGTFDGVKLYAANHNLSYKYYMPANGDKATDEDRYDAMKAACDNGAKAVVTAGFLQETALKKIAAEYPDVAFFFVDGGSVGANVAGIVFAEEQCGYLAGYAVVKEGFEKLGFTGGGGGTNPACVRYGYGFAQGANAAAAEMGKTVELNYTWQYGNSYSPSSELQALVNGWYNNGTEVIFCCGGNMYQSVAQAAAENDAYMVGVDTDQSPLSETIITSAMKGLAATVNTLLTEIKAGNFASFGGKVETLGLVSGTDVDANYVGIPASTQYAEGFTAEDYAALVAKMFAGEVTVSNDTETQPEVALTVTYYGNIK